MKKGFTLLEVLLATALLGVISVVVVGLCTRTLDVWGVASEKMEVMKKAKRVLDFIEEDIETAYPEFDVMVEEENTVMLGMQGSMDPYEQVFYRLKKEEKAYGLYRGADVVGRDIVGFQVKFRKDKEEGRILYAEISLKMVSEEKRKLMDKELSEEEGYNFTRTVGVLIARGPGGRRP